MSSKKQLQLPLRLPRPRRDKVARRDLNAAEFARALERNKFIQAGGASFFDATGTVGPPILAVHRTRPIRIARRATLAKLLRARNAAEKAADGVAK